MTVIYQQNSEL